VTKIVVGIFCLGDTKVNERKKERKEEKKREKERKSPDSKEQICIS